MQRGATSDRARSSGPPPRCAGDLPVRERMVPRRPGARDGIPRDSPGNRAMTPRSVGHGFAALRARTLTGPVRMPCGIKRRRRPSGRSPVTSPPELAPARRALVASSSTSRSRASPRAAPRPAPPSSEASDPGAGDEPAATAGAGGETAGGTSGAAGHELRAGNAEAGGAGSAPADTSLGLRGECTLVAEVTSLVSGTGSYDFLFPAVGDRLHELALTLTPLDDTCSVEYSASWGNSGSTNFAGRRDAGGAGARGYGARLVRFGLLAAHRAHGGSRRGPPGTGGGRRPAGGR